MIKLEMKLSEIQSGSHAGRVAIGLSTVYINHMKRLPGARYSKADQVWTIGKNYPSMAMLGSLAKELHMTLAPTPELLQWVKNEKAGWEGLTAVAQKMKEESPGIRPELYRHQVTDIEWLTYSAGPRGRLLLNDMGIGKTRSVVNALVDTKGFPAIVVAPHGVIETGWGNEFATAAPDVRVGLASGDINQRRKVIAQVAAGELDVMVIGYEALRGHTRFGSFGSVALKRCPACGGPPQSAAEELHTLRVPGAWVKAFEAGEIEIPWNQGQLAAHYLVAWRLNGGKRLKDSTVTMTKVPGEALEIFELFGAQEAVNTAKAATLEKLKAAAITGCQAHPKELNAIPWRVIVADEAHRILAAAGQTRLAVTGLIKSAPELCERWGLTGTPVSKQADALWSLLNFVDDDCWPVKSTWVDRYCEQGHNFYGFWEVTGFREDRKEELQKSLRAVTRRVLKAQVLDLPAQVRGDGLIHLVDMGTEQKKAYTQMLEELILQIDGGIITAANAPTQVGRLLMLATATGTPDPDEPSVMRLRAPSCKIDELVEMIKNQELGDQYAVAFLSRRSMILARDELVKRKVLKDEEIGLFAGQIAESLRTEAVNDFQAGKIPTIFFTHAAGGSGLTLHAAESLVLIERPWAAWQLAQSLGRTHRAGMPDRPTMVFDIMTKGTVDNRQLEKIKEDVNLLEFVVQDKEKFGPEEWKQRMKDFLLLK